jgi:hypothetical protein
MRRLSFIPFMLLLCIVAPIAAQDATPDTGWPIEQHCVGDPTPPPADWTYDGTILYQGEYGIHGLQSDWLTSRVLAFTNMVSPGNHIVRGALSPDKKWYAGAEGDSFCRGSCMSADEWVYSVYVFDITGNNPRKTYSIPWKLYYGRNTAGSDRPGLAWLDNEHIIYPFSAEPGGYGDEDEWIANPFTGEMNLWQGHTDLYLPTWNAPDFSRTLESVFNGDYDDSKFFHYLIATETGDILSELGDTTLLFLSPFGQVWSPDSSQFLAAQRVNDDTIRLIAYDREGQASKAIMEMPSQNLNGGYFYFWIKWSPDNKHIAVRWAQSTGEYGLQDYTTSIIDLEQEQITNMCLKEVEDFEWSPDSDQIIFEESGLFDLTEWKLYQLDVDGFVLGWRAD